MTKSTYIQIKRMLLKMRKELTQGIEESVREEKDDERSDVGDVYDIASSERDRELSLLLGERGREKLQEIDSALKRIEEGTYGICENCEEKIAPGRFKAMPFTRVCVNCKSKEERERGVVKTFDKERTHRQFTMTDVDED